MSDQTEVNENKEYPTQLFVTISGNHPMAEAALANTLSATFNEKGISGRRANPSEFDANFAEQTINGLANNANNSINVLSTQLTLNRMQGQTEAYEYPHWGDANQLWTTLPNDQLKDLWPTFNLAQKRAIYETLNDLNIQVEGEDEPLTLESALRIVHDESETFIRFNPNQDKTAFDHATIDGSFVDQAELHAILYVLNNAVPDDNGQPVSVDWDKIADEPTAFPPATAEETADVAVTPEFEAGENPAQSGAHPAPELPDGREVPEVPANPEPAAGPEKHPEQVNLTDGVPTVTEADPVLSPQVDTNTTQAAVGFDQQRQTTRADLPASGSVVQPTRSALEE